MQTPGHLTHLIQRCAECREVAALGRSLAAVGGRLEALLVAASSQGLEQEALTSSTILAGPALIVTTCRVLHPAAVICLLLGLYQLLKLHCCLRQMFGLCELVQIMIRW